MDGGKRLVAALDEQREHIFVTVQIASEVQRRKLQVAAEFLSNSKLSIPILDHLLNSGDKRAEELRKKLQAVREETKKLSSDLIQQVSESKDELSKSLWHIFKNAAKSETKELDHARTRKELGHPPGKRSDPLGDQISWEQLLTRCKKDKPTLWILTRDSDYAIKHEGKMFLNAALYQELCQAYGSAPGVYCFDNLTNGLKHFADTTMVRAEQLPKAEEAEKIKKEQESLPPMDWSSPLDAHLAAIRNALENQYSGIQAAWRALGNEIVIGPPPKKDK